MTNKKQIQASKYLSLVLRHKPSTIGLTLDKNGWTDTMELLNKINSKDFQLTFEELKEVVANNDKKRFVFSTDYSKIRANQGHSINVNLDLKEITPPEYLFHGTAERNINSIKNQGLIKGLRHHVHMSSDESTAHNVGKRYGKPVILKINSGQMYKHGIIFYQSENSVWLTDHIPSKYIEI